MDEESVVLLGVAQEKQGIDPKSPYICKAGGLPAWYAGKEPKEAKTLVCPKCRHHLFLVAQVYAPVDSDRTLYVFGCNSPECTEAPGSWRVLRDQVAPSDSVKPPATAVAPPASNAAVSVGWAAGDGDSDWSDDESDQEVPDEPPSVSGLGDLESLLQQRDEAMKNPTVASAPAPVSIDKSSALPNASPSTSPVSETTQLNCFPVVAIEVVAEPYEDYTKEHDYSHENKLLEEYMKSEEEEKSTDVNDLRRIIAGSKKKNGDAGVTSSSASTGESYERTPAQEKHFMRFQKRISRCPLQVLRYDYGGDPLWPVPVQKSKIKVPRCVCGEERAFEMQLTPTINYFLKVDDYAHTKLQLPQQQSSTGSTSGGGMDWASIVVYSCSKSCSQSNEEFVYVLPSHS